MQKLSPIDRDAVAHPAARGATDEADAGDLRWRDSLITPRVLPETRLLQLECEQAARWVAELQRRAALDLEGRPREAVPAP